MDIYAIVRDCIYAPRNIDNDDKILEVLVHLDAWCKRAYFDKDTTALLDANRTLFVINIALLSRPWIKTAFNINHPYISRVKYSLEKTWNHVERDKYKDRLASLPAVRDFSDWIADLVQGHSSYDVHPLYYFLRDEANFDMMREFTIQETPLEMLFGDIVALMMPGVYGGIKVELVKNFWDEVGHADDAKVHRNLRANLMRQLSIQPDFYESDVHVFVREELSLINMYFAMAMNRPKLIQLVGVMLATELMIPGRFEYLIAGWKRLGLTNEAIAYLTEHVSVDAKHSQDWLNKVVNPMLEHNPDVMGELVLGVLRRLDTAVDVSDCLMAYLKG